MKKYLTKIGINVLAKITHAKKYSAFLNSFCAQYLVKRGRTVVGAVSGFDQKNFVQKNGKVSFALFTGKPKIFKC